MPHPRVNFDPAGSLSYVETTPFDPREETQLLRNAALTRRIRPASTDGMHHCQLPSVGLHPKRLRYRGTPPAAPLEPAGAGGRPDATLQTHPVRIPSLRRQRGREAPPETNPRRSFRFRGQHRFHLFGAGRGPSRRRFEGARETPFALSCATMDAPMRQASKPTDRRRRRVEQAPASDETARFLRNLTSLPDAEFAATYSPAIHAVLARYADLPDPAAARRALLLALKAALKRRRAFILPRFTQAEDSWRIRECATYAVAVAVLVEHAAATLAPDRNAQPTDPDEWTRLLADPDADPHSGGSGSRAAHFHAILPARGRRWLACEPLVRTLVANYFTDTAPNELRDIVGPVVEGFGQERQTLSFPDNDDSRASSAGAPEQPSNSQPPPHRPQLLKRSLAWARGAFGGNRGPSVYRPPLHEEPAVTRPTLADHASTGDDAAARNPRPTLPPIPAPPPTQVAAPSSPPPKSATESQARAFPHQRHCRSAAREARSPTFLMASPAAPETPPPLSARPRDIGDHGASATRIGHAADYARGLMARELPCAQLPKPSPSCSGSRTRYHPATARHRSAVPL